MSARSLIVDRHPIGIIGVWRIRHGRTILASLVQPYLDISLGLQPTAEQVRQAVRDVSPGYGVTDVTPVTFREDADVIQG